MGISFTKDLNTTLLRFLHMEYDITVFEGQKVTLMMQKLGIK